MVKRVRSGVLEEAERVRYVSRRSGLRTLGQCVSCLTLDDPSQATHIVVEGHLIQTYGSKTWFLASLGADDEKRARAW